MKTFEEVKDMEEKIAQLCKDYGYNFICDEGEDSLYFIYYAINKFNDANTDWASMADIQNTIQLINLLKDAVGGIKIEAKIKNSRNLLQTKTIKIKDSFTIENLRLSLKKMTQGLFKSIDLSTGEEFENPLFQYNLEKELELFNASSSQKKGYIASEVISLLGYLSCKHNSSLGTKTKQYSFVYDLMAINGDLEDIGLGEFSGVVASEKHKYIDNYMKSFSSLVKKHEVSHPNLCYLYAAEDSREKQDAIDKYIQNGIQ